MRQKKAFTLIELVVAVVILGILVTLGLASLSGRKMKAEYNGAVAQVVTIAAAEKTFFLTQGYYIATTSTANTNSELGIRISDGYFQNYRVTSVSPVTISVTGGGCTYTFDSNGNRISATGTDCLP